MIEQWLYVVFGDARSNICSNFHRINSTDATHCNQRDCLFVCLSVSLSGHISQKLHVQISPNFLYML